MIRACPTPNLVGVPAVGGNPTRPLGAAGDGDYKLRVITSTATITESDDVLGDGFALRVLGAVAPLVDTAEVA
jgi:hypothetical protein